MYGFCYDMFDTFLNTMNNGSFKIQKKNRRNDGKYWTDLI